MDKFFLESVKEAELGIAEGESLSAPFWCTMVK